MAVIPCARPYHVADADGPDGGNNVSNTDDIDQSDLPNLKCPGETIRCLISVDVSTEPKGWGTNPENSFKVEIQQ
jgi:hypothetical protein